MSYWNYAGKSKYHAAKVQTDEGTFDSRKEYRRWQELKLLEQAGEISGLSRQKKYLLIPEQREADKTGPRGGKIRGKVLEKACWYIADFVYQEDGQTVVEDTKGVRTDVYRIKRKLMLQNYGIRIRET